MQNILWIFLLLLFGSIRLSASTLDYGLYFQASEVSVTKRTSLQLDGGKDFALKDNFQIDFKMNLRNNESGFGSVMHLSMSDSLVIHLMLAVDESNHIYPAVVFNDNITYFHTPLYKDEWVPVSVRLNKRANQMTLLYGRCDTTISVPLQDCNSFKITMGKIENFSKDVAPMSIRDLSLHQDRTEIRFWKFSRHNDNICRDELTGAKAVSESAYWLIDNHMKWKKIYQATYPKPMLVAFNARDAYFYLVKEEQIEVYDEYSTLKGRYPIAEGLSGFNNLNHCIYDTLTNELIAYSLSAKQVARFSFETCRWTPVKQDKVDATHFNHALALSAQDSSYYFFGGYGHFRYHSDLFRLRVHADTIESVAYQPEIYPRFASAMAVVDDKAYILGGRGNKIGKQAIESYYYYDLWQIDLRTQKAKMLWSIDDKQNRLGLILTSSMYYNPADSCFYVVNMDDEGGKLLRFNTHTPQLTAVSDAVLNGDEYQDFDYKLCYSDSKKKFYLVVDKILNNRSHNLSIYSINTPLLGEADLVQASDEMEVWHLLAYGIVALVLLFLGWFAWKRRRQRAKVAVKKLLVQPDEAGSNLDAEANAADCTFKKEVSVVEPHYYDRSHAAVSMLGPFMVRDREGNDITYQFTPRLRELFLVLILFSEKETHGIPVKRLTEMLWFDKEESQARNNRNVTVRKLRVLLEMVGSIDIVNDNGTMRIEWGDVFCDYHTMLTFVKGLNYNEQIGDEELNRILELLLYGPLLPNTLVDWLDDFKSDYSSLSVDLLKWLLGKMVKVGNLKMQLRIADIMFLHDPLSEEALAAKCLALFKQGKKGIAKNLYDRFCKEYKETLAEPYKIAFSDLENLCN